MDRIVFLDIDGPMIPGTRLLLNRYASIDQVLDSRSVLVLHKILGDFDAKIVFNTYHNNWLYHSPGGSGEPYFEGTRSDGLVARFEEAGFKDYIHPTVSTTFPNIKVGRSESGRLPAIQKWLADNGNHNWVCFDDEYIENVRAYQVNYEHGIGTMAYQHAEYWFNGEKAS